MSQTKLEAVINIIKPLPQFENKPAVNNDRNAEITSLAMRLNMNVPLLELYSTANEDNADHFEKTAEVIEHVR